MEMTCQEGNLHNTMNTYLCASVCVSVCSLLSILSVRSPLTLSLSCHPLVLMFSVVLPDCLFKSVSFDTFRSANKYLHTIYSIQ